jgi:hypothetical protein
MMRCPGSLPTRARLVSVALMAALLTLAVSVAIARAGTWIQVSCVNPNGSAAPSEGWSDGASGPSDPWGTVDTACTTTSPMVAALPDVSAAPPSSALYLEYAPPAGSTLIGGTVGAEVYANGYGVNAQGQPDSVAQTRLYEPDLVDDASDEFFQCVAWLAPCPGGSSLDYTGVITLPSDRGGDFFAEAKCVSNDGNSCDLNSYDGVWAQTDISWARMLLSSSVSPQGTNFSGSALQKVVRGTGHMVFTAGESQGPGIYEVSVALDGRTVWAGSPNTNGGECVAVGRDPTTSALMFDHQAPCLNSEVVDVPVPTAGFPDGANELAITVTDAAQNSSTVFDQTIDTSNPQTTPRPHGARSIHARFVISWRWAGSSTVLRSILVNHLPRGSGVSVRCSGRRCPRLRLGNVDSSRIRTLLKALDGRRFHAGDQLGIDVTERRHRAEHIVLDFRDGSEPLARLLKR